MAAEPSMQSMRLVDFSDRELLLILNDVADGEGWASARDIAGRINFSVAHGHRNVAIRLSWLQRYGAVEREHLYDEHGNPLTTRSGEHKRGQRWRLTPEGAAMALGRLNARRQESLERISPEELLVVTRWLTQRYRQQGDTGATLMRREWVYGTSALRSLNGSNPDL